MSERAADGAAAATPPPTAWIMRVAIAGTAVLAVYLLGVGRWILLPYVVYVVGEAVRRYRHGLVTPDPVMLFVVGWVAPFALTFIPVERVIFRVEPLDARADLVWLGCLLVFLWFSVAAASVLRAWSRGRGADPAEARPAIPWSLTVATMLLSNLGFMAAAAASGFRFPLFQADVTAAATEFFGLRGTASLFDVGKVGLLLCGWWIVHLVRRREGRLRTVITLVLALVFVAEQLLTGKRMGLLLAVGALGIVLATLRVLRARHVAVALLLSLVFVTANAYTRAKPYFDTGWRNEEVSALSDLWQLAALQPVVYVTETFANLGTVAEGRVDPRRTAWSDYLFRRTSEEALAAPTDEYLELRGRGKMVPFVGAGLASGGVLAGLLVTLLFAAIAWIAYAWSQRSVGLIIYADLGARYLIVWTGNFLINGGTYYNLAYVVVLLALASVARLEHGANAKTGTASGTVPADE